MPALLVPVMAESQNLFQTGPSPDSTVIVLSFKEREKEREVGKGDEKKEENRNLRSVRR